MPVEDVVCIEEVAFVEEAALVEEAPVDEIVCIEEVAFVEEAALVEKATLVEEAECIEEVAFVEEAAFVKEAPVEEVAFTEEAVPDEEAPVETAELVKEVVPVDNKTLAEAVVLVDDTTPAVGAAEVVEDVVETAELPGVTWTTRLCAEGTGDDTATPEEVVLMYATLDAVLTLVIEEDIVTAAFWYMFKRLGPPQYSEALPEQIMLHVVSAGESPATSTEPVLMTLPQ